MVQDPGEAGPRVGVSACLLGDTVRYDGTHRRVDWLTGVLGRHVRFVAVCPEMEAGLGVPREPVRLEGDPPRMIGFDSGRDATPAMTRVAQVRIRGFRRLDLAGYVFKKGSPSCGPDRVPWFTAGFSTPEDESGPGLFAGAVMREFPFMPAVDEDLLERPGMRTSFAVRVFLHACWRRFAVRRYSLGALREFNAVHRALIAELDPVAAQALDQQLRGARLDADSARARFARVFHRALDRPMDRAAVTGTLECPRCRRWESVKRAA